MNGIHFKARLATLVLTLSLSILVLTGNAFALPSSDVVVNYTDYPQVSGTLKGLNTVTVTNVYNGSGREHDNTRGTQNQLNSWVHDTGGVYFNTFYTTNGPHGKFTDNTNACGRCHALHTANSARLIRFETMPVGGTAQNTIYGTCTYCHNFNGQSTYDVKDGMIWDTNDGKRYATMGGGFERMLVVEGEPDVATVVKASSSHMVNKATGTKFRAPGGYMGANTNAHIELTCSTCHNPHGSNNSRLLRETVTTGSVGGVPTPRQTWQDDYVLIKVENAFGNETSMFNNEISYFCSRCHNDYKSTGAINKTGAYSQAYRHKIGMFPNDGLNNGSGSGFGYNNGRMLLPTATFPSSNTPGTVECLTCHFAHGTYVRVKSIATYDNIYVSSGSNTVNMQNLPGYPNQEPPKNLRMDNRGVCQNCHQWSSVSPTAPALADVLDPTQDGSVLYGDTGTLLAATKVLSPNSGSIIIRFDQYVLKNGANGAETIANFSLQNLTDTLAVPLSSAAVQPDGRTVVIRPTAGLLAGKNYRLTVQNISDSNGTVMSSPATADFSK